MKLDVLNCPACNYALGNAVNPNQPFKCPACGSMIVSTDWTKSGQPICSGCGTVNASSNRFCEACGAALQVGCPFCYTLNSLTTVKCKNCGANLQRAWKRQQNWLAEKKRHDLERKEALEEAARSQDAYLQRLLLQLDDPQNHPTAIPSIRLFGEEAVEPLIQLLSSKDPDARFGAARVLGDIGDRRAVPELVKILGDAEASVRYWAVDALGKLHASEAVQAIRKLVNDKYPSIKQRAKDVLKQLESPTGGGRG